MFSVEGVVRGYHKYKDIWDAAIDELKLPCEREPGNPHDSLAIAVVKRSPGTSVIVGHVPRLLDKSAGAKYWQMTFNSPKFSTARICYEY